MIAAADLTRGAADDTSTLESHARTLAEGHRAVEAPARFSTTAVTGKRIARALEHARRCLGARASDDPTLPRAAEWFLDNYYLIRRVARQIEEDLPDAFARHLPRVVGGAPRGASRVEALARALLAETRLDLDGAAVARYVDAYQQVVPLTIAELWALPTMLRAAVLRHLVRFLDESQIPAPLSNIVGSDAAEPPGEAIGLDPRVGVETAVRALRVLDAIDWQTFFVNASRVEAILRSDPAAVYARMDFATRDSYRRVVEELARGTGRTETTVADLAIARAAEQRDHRRGHVGYYLIDDGRTEIEQALEFRAVGRERIRRAVTRRPTASYLGPIALFTALPLVALAWGVARAGASAELIAASVAVAAIPISVFVVSALQAWLGGLLPPRTLPKLDFSKAIPAEARTLVVIPTLLGRPDDVDHMVRQLELHYLSNPDPQLRFAALTDGLDSAAKPDDATLIGRAARAIDALNAAHGGPDRGPFHLLHREPRWNPREQRFMGWERKRGKLEELNRLLRGDTETSYVRHVGDRDGLLGIRFVITLDSDTQLPMGAAHRLVGLLAHPLNRAVFDDATGRVIGGYTIVQPRIETSPSSARPTRFSRVFAGDIGFDIYTHAVSETYQDLFGSGIYVGKGIYEIDTFMRSVEGRAPENTIVSHDLFEGVHGRAALATDIVLFEEFPTTYPTYSKRMHRWVRGDWQLFPWLLPRVPTVTGPRAPNKLSHIDRWKIFDNLRRSLGGPAFLLQLVLGWTCLPGSPLLWTIAALALLVAPQASGIARDRRRRLVILERTALAIVFLAHESAVVVDAIVRVAVRVVVTRKHMLQWTTAASAERGAGRRSARRLAWGTLIWSPLLAIGTALLILWARPDALAVAAPILLAWLVAPELASWISRPPAPRVVPLRDSQLHHLRLLARRTWRFFDTFVGPGDQWLPIDNYQAEPHEQTAHRTSPTNIGLMMLSTLSAYDFGYLGASGLSVRIRRAFDSIARLEHYQGHLLNWYDTKNLQPLLPRYVSTVDSGNFAGCLIALAEGARDVAASPIVRREMWDGIGDSVDVLASVIDTVPRAAASPLRAVVARIHAAVERGRDDLSRTYPALSTLTDDLIPELDREVLEYLDVAPAHHESDLLRSLREAIDRLHRQSQHVKRELDTLLPWLALADEPAARAHVLPWDLRLEEIPERADQLRRALDVGVDTSTQRLSAAFGRGAASARTLHAELLALAVRAEKEVHGIDFRLLYDGDRKLFRIGYNATVDQLDANYYDLLASEARLASYLAIVKGDVPQAHWYALGRPMTEVAGAPMLLSWGGTMFEYLMPELLMRSQPGTLLARTSERVVDAQIAWGEAHGEPWGVSESAYARVDAASTYQYRSFGVPGLGFKRGLEDDRVIAPYASALAVAIRPHAVVDNFAALEAKGMLGTYGLFEALDLDPERASAGHDFTVVRSYMAHHQGMLLVALGNLLNRRSMVDRFHADPMIETGEVLLNEQSPLWAPAEWPVAAVAADADPEHEEMPHAPAPWSVTDPARPQAFVLGNGHMTSLITDGGGGGLSWNGLALTRYEPDATHDRDGLWIYLRDEDSRRVWRATSSEGRTTFAMHKVELHHRDEGISVHVDVAVAPADDVEVRQITLRNETDQLRRLTVTSAGRPVLLDAKQAPVHPAFSGMFVESTHAADLDGVVLARRPQSSTEEPAVLVHRLARGSAGVTFAGYETDRDAFYGRGGSIEAPRALAADRGPLRGRAGAVLDPIMSVMAKVELKPKGSVTLAFVTTVARSRSAATELARRYGTMHAVRWAFRDAELESPRRLVRNRIEPDVLTGTQRLLSALLFADPTLRAAPDPGVPRPSRQRLWGRGISGDYPIVVVRVHDASAKVLRDVLAAQRYLRACRVRFDLVLLDEQASGYLSEGSGTLRRVLAQHGDDDRIDASGGIFVLAVDQAPEDERRHLEGAARVVLDTRDGSLAARLGRTVAAAPRQPRFEASRLPGDAVEPAPPRPALVFDNGTGGFSADGREYVIAIPAGATTPAPWCNVIANADVGCLVSESSLGTTWSLNAGENKLTPWRNDAVLDTPAEIVYLRDEETAAVWSPTPLPAGQGSATTVRHGAGYSSYQRSSHGLDQVLTVFVPPDAPIKIVRLRLDNRTDRHRRVTATYYAEWVLGPRRAEQASYVVSELDLASGCLLARCDWSAEFAGRVAFLSSHDKVHGFTTDRTELLGRRGDYARPEALERWGLSGSVVPGVDPCGALQIHLELAPGAHVETHFVIGQAANRDAAIALVDRFRETAAVEAAWTALGAFWDATLGNIQIKTPEPAMDVMLNRWLLYQALSARLFGRIGFYQASGAFGYRDQLQDVLALIHAAPARTRAHLLEAAAHQFEAGDVLHWWHPPSGRGVRTRCSDDLIWLPFVTAEYVLATGDLGVLDAQVPFLIGDLLEPDEHDRYAQYEVSKTTASLFEHCRRALEHGATEGAHGLPLMGEGDWNDGMNRIGALGRGESVWLGWFLCATMDRFAVVCDRMSDPATASRWHARAAALRAKIKSSSWDGDWYLRAFHDDGSRVGSAANRECRIDSIAQSWAALSTAPGEPVDARAQQAVLAADRELVRDDERLVLLFWPPFDTTSHDPGYVRAYPPGIRENGGQYTHGATWLGWAHAAAGDGERAANIFRVLNPVLRSDTAEAASRYRVEPYALAADIYSCAPWVGRGGWTWYTGSAAWMWRLGIEAILGLRRRDGLLSIEPCIPPEWPGYEAWVEVGRARVHVVVENPDRQSTGVADLTLDGTRLDGTQLRIDGDLAGTHEVRVRLGAHAASRARTHG